MDNTNNNVSFSYPTVGGAAPATNTPSDPAVSATAPVVAPDPVIPTPPAAPIPVPPIDAPQTPSAPSEAPASAPIKNPMMSAPAGSTEVSIAQVVDTPEAAVPADSPAPAAKSKKGKSPLEALAEKLNKFKESLVEEDDAKKKEIPTETADIPTPVPISSASVKEEAPVPVPPTPVVPEPVTPVAPTPVVPVPPIPEPTPTVQSDIPNTLPSAEVSLDPAKQGPQDPVAQKPVSAQATPIPTPPVEEKPVEKVPEPVKQSKAPPPKKEVKKEAPKPKKKPPVKAPPAPAPKPIVMSDVGEYPYTMGQLLDIVVERGGSDLHITAGYPASVRVDGKLLPVVDKRLSPELAKELVLSILPDGKKELLDVNREVDLAYEHSENARFRINAYYQQQTLAGAFRLIPNRIKSIDELRLPQIYHQLTKLRQGLVLVTGPTGSGKSTTLASIIQEINETREEHIITIEDPIEFIFPKSKAMIDQRELHEDTHSWEIAMKSALRQDPDVVLIGEMRDYETISSAITLAETGHLVFATLHTNSAAQSVDRIIDVFPEHQQAQVRSQLSNVLEAVIAQRLIPLDKGGRQAASEIMIATPAIRNLIREGKTHQIDNVISTSADIGMLSMERALVNLVRENLITMERAQEYAVHPEEVVRLLKG